MKNYNRNLCVLALLLLLGIGNCGFAQDAAAPEVTVQTQDTQEKIKANKETLSKAQTAMDNKDYQSAINYLTGYLSSKDKKYEIYKLRGDAYYALRRYDLAREDYQTAVDLKSADDKLATNTKYVSAIILGADKNEQLQNTELGNLYASLMYAQKALNNPAYTASYDNAVKYNSHIYLPQPNKADINKINCPQKYGKPLNPTGNDTKLYSAIDDIQKNDFHSAIFKIQEIINLYPNYYMGYYLMGVALTGLEQDDEAIKSFEKALALNPYDFESYASLGQIYYDRAETNFSSADSAKSVEYFSKALAYNSNCPAYYFYIGLNKLNTGDFSSAVKNFDNALRIDDNDYNSRYYKSITQYINGDYNSVVSETSKLINKHVSNYNSVLYLRALAYNKLGEKDKALADLDAIGNNIHDVFNSDIKTNSPKDMVLVGYTDYLRSLINNTPAGANLNPTIKKLSAVQTGLKPYEGIINAKNISPDDYKKLEALYTVSLPKILANVTPLNYESVENQYDFIRTTFSDLGISFEPKGNDSYGFTTLKNYYKKYESKQSSERGLPTGGMSYVPVQPLNPIISESNNSEKLLLQAGETSLAQMMASNVLAKRVMGNSSAAPYPALEMPSPQWTAQQTEFKPEIPAAEAVKNTPAVVLSEPYNEPEKQLISESNMKKVKGIIEAEKSMPETKQGMVFTAKEIKPAQEFRIYNEPVYKESEKTVSPKVEVETAETGTIKISAKEIKETPDVVVRNVLVVPEDSSEVAEKLANNVQKTNDYVEGAKENINNLQTQVNENINKTQSKINDAVAEAKNQTFPSDSPSLRTVYNGLSSAASNYNYGKDADVVELDLSGDNSGSTVFTDRLGYGLGAKPANIVFDSDLNTVKNNEQNIIAKAQNLNTSTQRAFSDKKEEVVKNAEEVQDKLAMTQTDVSEVVVPKINGNSSKGPAIRLVAPEDVVPELSDEEVEKIKREKANKVLSEYERLLKEQEKNEKIEKQAEERLAKVKERNEMIHQQEEAKLLKERIRDEKLQKALEEKKIKEQAKALKLKEKEEQKAKLAQEKAQKALENAKIKEEKMAALREANRIKAEEKAQAKLIAQQQAAEKQAQKTLEAEKIKNEKLAAKQINDKIKAEQKAYANQLKQERAQAVAERKAKEEKAKQIVKQEKLAAKQEADKIKAVQKANADKIARQEKEAKAKVQAEQRVQRKLTQSKEKLAKEQQKAQATLQKESTQKQSLISVMKEKLQRPVNNSEDKAAKLLAKEQQRAKAEQLKAEKAKAKAIQDAKNAEIKEQEKIKAEQLKAEKAKAKAIQDAKNAKIKEQEKIAKEQKLLEVKKKEIQKDVMRGQNNVVKIRENAEEIKTVSKEAVASAKKEKASTPKILVPKINSESKVVPIKLQNPESMAVVKSDTASEVRRTSADVNENLQEYERLLSQQTKREKFLKEEEEKQIKEQEKIQKEIDKEQEKFLENRHKEYIKSKERKIKNTEPTAKKESFISKLKEKFNTENKVQDSVPAQRTVLKSMKDGNVVKNNNEALIKAEKKAEKEQQKAALAQQKAKLKAQKEKEKAAKKALKEKQKAEQKAKKEVSKSEKVINDESMKELNILTPKAVPASMNRYINNAVKGKQRPTLRF